MKIKHSKTYYTPQDLADENDARILAINSDFVNRVDASAYPCVGAKSAVRTKQYRMGVYDKMGSVTSTSALAEDLKTYIEQTDAANSQYMTMIAVFTDTVQSELDFEKRLWLQLQALHDMEAGEHVWDPTVSHDPQANDFSFSFSGSAFFVVGMHPLSSRKARRFGYCAMAFNLHRQFEQLRENNLYEKMKSTIREREVKYDGAINPMLNDHGDGLEAPQYSGRAVDSDWKCPFSY